MKLRYSHPSPYARKVRVVAHELGLSGDIELIATDTWNRPDALLTDNPLGKVPALITTEGEILYDSPVICEYLASLRPNPTLYPVNGAPRWRTLRLQALGDGIMDAAVERYAEQMFRPADRQLASWSDRLADGIRRALRHLESNAGEGLRELSIGPIAVACALGYLDFRFAEDRWRDGHGRLAEWYDAIVRRESFRATTPRDPG